MCPQPSRKAAPDSLLARVARAIPDLTLDEMAARTGISRSQLSAYENGENVPEAARKLLAGAAGVSLPYLEALLPFLRILNAPAGEQEAAKTGLTAAQEIAAQAAAVLSLALGEKLAEGTPAPPLPADDPETVEALWTILARCTPRQRRLRVQAARRYWSRALSRRLLAESEQAATADPELARELAQLAGVVARQADGLSAH
jgi:transcriptional regulator with XRE-family HTH domain